MRFAFRLYSGVPADPISFWQKLHPNPRHGFILGSGAGSKNDSVVYLSAAEPARIFRSIPLGASKILQTIKQSFSVGLPVPRFVGYLGFEAGRAFDPGIGRLPIKPNPLGTPGAFFGDYDAVVKIDFDRRETTLFYRGDNQKTIRLFETCWGAGGSGAATCEARPPFGGRARSGSRVPGLQISQSKIFSKIVSTAKEAIARGDIYQANLSLRFRGKFAGDPVQLYRELCQRNPSPYACLLKCGADWIVSCSPELLLKTEGRRAITRPIAGTRPRGKTERLDVRRRGQLLLSPKERAEHIMLVDLERNDLGRVCDPGTVKVTENYAVERYSHVMHIVSQVEGKLSPRRDSVSALKAMFPGGTITGCPKIKAIEIIERLEGAGRGPFYGSAGFFCENGDATFNILIRTALIQKKSVSIQAGAGIVTDSHPVREYREVLAKAQVLLEAAGGAR